VLASDAKFFHQANAAIGTIRRFSAAFRPSIKFVAIDLQRDQLRFLERQGVDILTELDSFPCFCGAPRWAVALTCRPYLPEVFPGYECYIWVDSDIRFLDEEGFGFLATHGGDREVSIVASHETDPAYCINSDPLKAGIYHRQKNQRLVNAFGSEIAEYLEFYNMYNAGLFSARGDSPVWARYKRNLEKTLSREFSPMSEQDALNVAIIEVGSPLPAPCTMNWLCSLAMPRRNGDGSWHTPDLDSRRVSVAHLTNSTSAVQINGKPATIYDYYRLLGLTE
jgi:hypothetical protein